MSVAKALLITRPAHQAQGLVEACQTQGIRPFVVPALAIEAHPAEAYTSVEVMIVTSANSVHFGLNWLKSHRGTILAVGQATRRAIEKAGFSVDFSPEVFDSEHLLAWPGFAQIKGKKVGLLKGLGGRTLIAETLQQSGAQVIEWPVYRRQALLMDAQTLQAFADFDGQGYVLASSQAVLEALDRALMPQALARVRHLPLLVFSKSAFTRAQQLGWKQVKITKLANESSIIDWIVE